ncbi:MAG TPA: hypothetical protein VMH32_11765 [Burkholderiales bacterium]|nr:hypothetical protein [Burkholderiales bacterium]
MADLNEVRYVKRIIVGSDNPARIRTQAEIDDALALLNKCLTGTPKGTILGVEKSFTILHVGEHQVVMQWFAYHVGFPRKPVWLPDEEAPKPG